MWLRENRNDHRSKSFQSRQKYFARSGHWAQVGVDYEETMLWAAATVCYFGFMQAGELLMDRKSGFDPSQHLALEDVATDEPTMEQITLKHSKIEPFRKGVDTVVGTTGDKLCQVKALFRYLQMRGRAPGPLPMQKDGSLLTRSYFVAKVRGALSAFNYTNTAQYSRHSFRVGAATTTAVMEVEDSVIKTLRRWESAAYLLYVRIPKEELKELSSTLSMFGLSK